MHGNATSHIHVCISVSLTLCVCVCVCDLEFTLTPDLHLFYLIPFPERENTGFHHPQYVCLYALSNFKIVLLYSNENQTYWLEFKLYVCIIRRSALGVLWNE